MYPFGTAWKKYLASEDAPSVEDLVGAEEYASLRHNAICDLDTEIESASPNTVAGPGSELYPHFQSLSYVYKRIVLSTIADKRTIGRFALSEGLRLTHYLEKEDFDRFIDIAADLGVKIVELPSDTLNIHFLEYMRLAPSREDTWEPTFNEMNGGFVVVTRERATRLLQEAWRRQLEKELPRPIPDDIKTVVDQDAGTARIKMTIERLRPKYDTGVLQPGQGAWPPCMVALRDRLAKGDNVPHYGRVALATFALNTGMKPEDVGALFVNAPDYKPAVTNYQVNHLASTGYTAPGCERMERSGLCCPDDKCSRWSVKNPLVYFRRSG